MLLETANPKRSTAGVGVEYVKISLNIKKCHYFNLLMTSVIQQHVIQTLREKLKVQDKAKAT